MALQAPASWSSPVATCAVRFPGGSPSFSGEQSSPLPAHQQPRLGLCRDQAKVQAKPDPGIWCTHSSHSKKGTVCDQV